MILCFVIGALFLLFLFQGIACDIVFCDRGIIFLLFHFQSIACDIVFCDRGIISTVSISHLFC